MTTYYVEMYVYHPYKIEASFMEETSNYGIAIRRAIKKFRALPKLKGKRIEQIWCTARRA